jgi:hypothetical protein
LSIIFYALQSRKSQQLLEGEPVSPHRLNDAIPRDLETICLKCLEKEPRRRYGSAQAAIPGESA